MLILPLDSGREENFVPALAVRNSTNLYEGHTLSTKEKDFFKKEVTLARGPESFRGGRLCVQKLGADQRTVSGTANSPLIFFGNRHTRSPF